MKNIVVDYESYYSKKDKISVTDLGNPNYFAASDAYILSVVSDDISSCGTLAEIRGHFSDDFWTNPNHQFWAANSNFDYGWHRKYFPDTARPWKCILDKGVFHQFPRALVGLAKCALGVHVDKTLRDEMDGVHYEELPAAKQIALQEYCLNDSVQEFEILNRLGPMSPLEEDVADHTRLINRRGVAIDTDLLKADIERLYTYRDLAFKQIPWSHHAKPLSYDALSNYCDTKGVPCPKSTSKTDEECGELVDAHPALAEALGAMRRFRRSNTVLKKAKACQLRIHDGIMPLDILYCGAPHTRRWSSKGFNVQNLDKEPLVVTGSLKPGEIADLIDKGEPMPGDCSYVWSRNWIVPRPGKIFLILDFAQIEPRCLNWLAGNMELLEAMRAGYSYYEAYSRAAKGWKGAPGTLKKELGIVKYTKIKNEALGCGYGMGASKYTTYANVPEAEAKQIVADFRRTNPKVVNFWRRLDSLIVSAARSPEKVLGLQLPTGDYLKHFDVRATGRGFKSITIKGDYSNASVQLRLWGGTLTENVTQRMARDVLANGVVALEKAGLPVVFHAHDEVILEVDDDNTKEDAQKTAEQILTTPPAWAPELPLGVEGGFSNRYTK